MRGLTFDAAGAFRFEELDAGAYEVEAIVLGERGAGPDPLRARVVVEDGKTSEVVLTRR